MPIPKIIHQTWKTEAVPPQWRSYQQKVKALHPGWEYRLWTDDNNDRFVREYFPDFYNIYATFPKNIMRADVIRYLVMYQYGGLYLDLDYEMLTTFRYTTETLVLPVSRDLSLGDKRDLLGNCIFASEPGHVFWKDMIGDLILHPPAITHYEDVLHTTGPEFLSRIFYKGNYPDACLPEKSVYHPMSPRSKSDYRAILREGIAEGIHHAHGSWRERTVVSRMKTGLRKLLQRENWY
jgi:mannosyltransferase OCH1-like enzyme